MKTAISIPDPVFAAAEDAAKRMHVSRSQLYARAVAMYVKLLGGSNVTKNLNAVYSGETAPLESGIKQAQARMLARDKW